MRLFLSSKLHKATVTEADLSYTGSITIDRGLMRAVDLREYEKVLVVDNTNGTRLETYVIPGPEGSGRICMNGAAAHLVQRGDEITIMAFQLGDGSARPKAVLLDAENRIVRPLSEPSEVPV